MSSLFLELAHLFLSLKKLHEPSSPDLLVEFYDLCQIFLHYYLRIENAEGYVLIAVYLFIYLFVCVFLA